MHRFRRSWLPFVVAALAVLVVLPSLAGPTDAATSKWIAKCDDVRHPNRAQDDVEGRRSLDAGARRHRVGTVTGGKWSARCAVASRAARG